MATTELIMERIRSKANQYKSFAECAKTVRMSQLEKRFPMDMADRHQLQKCLDTLQQSMKVTTLQGIIERLESISRQLSLKLMPGPTGLELFISSDMFYLEVSLEYSGSVKDVKVHHEGKLEQQSCDELVKSLSKGDFEDFTTQLQGLISIYQLNAEKKVKCKAFSALCALEADLDVHWSLQSSIKNVQTLLNKSPVGVLEKRKGGHPMKLTYFVSPYEVLELKKYLTVDLIYKNKIGNSVTICLEGSAAHKLQISPLIIVNKNTNKSTVSYAPMTPTNSTTLPAYFVLKLNKPQPICLELVKHINAISELECCDTSNPHPLFSLITQHVSNGKMDSSLNKGLFVNLPDQVHCYFMTECRSLDGVMLSSIPFTHPSQVPLILTVLRQQAMFNALVSSVIRPHSKEDIENVIMLEVSALSCQHISVSFEHPLQESMSTIEIDLSDISCVRGKLYSTTTETNVKTSTEHISKILQRCLSIPVTMRYLIKTLQNQPTDNGLSAVNNGNFSSAPNGGLGNGTDHSPMDTSKIKQEPGLSNGMSGRNGTLRNQFDDFSSFSNAVLDNNMQKTSNILNMVAEQQKQQQKKRKHEKHWKSPKQKSVDECEILVESSSNDSISTGTPMEVDLETDFLAREKEEPVETNEVDDVEEMLKATAGPARTDIKFKKSKEMKRSPSRSSLIMDLTDGKGLVPPSVTITPITSNTPNINSVLERRPGIEIIPLSGASSLTSSITITPISSSSDKDDRKNYKSRNVDDKVKEKKRKRKREDESGSKMGPPEKVPIKSDPLSKPVSVSIIKPTTDSPPAMNRPSSPSVRKYSASPTQFREKSGSSGAFQPSPKHSPAYGASPKHSPKHGSPKQPSSGSGKPSMSTLKSASSSANSLKSSEGKTKSSGAGSAGTGNSGMSKEQREKDSSRKSSGSSSGSSSSGSPKIKSSSVKLKQLDISSEVTATISGRSTPPNSSSSSDPKNLGNPLQRNRKGSLSAVIDKLKSAQEVGDPTVPGTKRDSSTCGSSKEGKVSSGLSATTISKINLDGKAISIQKIPDGVKNPGEYMVKQSSDGMKLLINKKSKESSKMMKSGSSSGTGSPKTHTGLKPGVISGPASKKPTSSKTLGLSGTSKMSSSLSKPSSGLKAALSKSLSSKGSGSPKLPGSGTSELVRKDNSGKSRSVKTNSEKSLFKEAIRKGSPAPSRDEEHERTMKVLKMESGLPPSLVVEGLIKPFDTKFQIPKLSARNNNNNSAVSTGNTNPNIGSTNTGSNVSVSGNTGSGTSQPNTTSSTISGNNVASSGGSTLNNNSSVNSSNSGANTGGSTCNVSNVSNNLTDSVNLTQTPAESNDPNTGATNNNNNNISIMKSGSEKIEKSEVKVLDVPVSKTSLDMAATLKYQTSKHDAKVPNSNVPNLLSLPMALTNVSPKLPMTSPNLPTTSLSSITSKLDRGDDSGLLESPIAEKMDVDTTSTVDVTTVKFQSASLLKQDELKKSTDVSKHIMSSQQTPEILLDFSSSLTGKILAEKTADKTLVGTTPSCFIKPNSPAIFHKSPVQSPINVSSQSPQSITDDELMDEALMLRK
ncbi:hypothetical protein RUM44_002650 [Polyplax serrata]|uniref:Mediator of RNA polymerase II transcription subunit 1 n=1 Tax=Polyplax serrata TaxID=468196 RepID=A0ABR1AFC8_POLSC